MSSGQDGRTADPLFVGATRPPMRWGVTYAALLFNLVFTMEAFLLTRNLLALLTCVPVHGICWLLCARDPRFFDLAILWMRTRLPALLANLHVWHAASYSPLLLDLPGRSGRRRAAPVPRMRFLEPVARQPNRLKGTGLELKAAKPPVDQVKLYGERCCVKVSFLNLQDPEVPGADKLGGQHDIALGKARERGIGLETVKPFIETGVQVPPPQSRSWQGRNEHCRVTGRLVGVEA